MIFSIKVVGLTGPWGGLLSNEKEKQNNTTSIESRVSLVDLSSNSLASCVSVCVSDGGVP